MKYASRTTLHGFWVTLCRSHKSETGNPTLETVSGEAFMKNAG
jgi:hypothetical protein